MERELLAERASGAGGFAVVDLETTGLYPSTDRIVEIAVLLLDGDAQVTLGFCTLVDPCRDVGPTRIHGIRASDVVGAPTFAAVAAAIWSLLSGRVLVAHNASFDARFLDAEFGRLGVWLPPPPVMCTMSLATHYLRDLPARSLPACCAAAGVALSCHHSAADDAAAAAGLLARFRAAHQQLPASWANALHAAALASWTPGPIAAEFCPVTRAEQVLRWNTQRAPLAMLADRLPRGAGSDTDAYLGVLDRILEDRFVSASELSDASKLAGELGLTRDAAQRAHREYLQHVAAAAWRDRQVTDAERQDLLEVARLLGVSTGEALGILQDARFSTSHPSVPGATPLQPGDRVVFTGNMDTGRPQIEKLAATAGLRVTSSSAVRQRWSSLPTPTPSPARHAKPTRSASAWSPSRSSCT